MDMDKDTIKYFLYFSNKLEEELKYGDKISIGLLVDAICEVDDIEFLLNIFEHYSYRLPKDCSEQIAKILLKNPKIKNIVDEYLNSQKD